MLVDHPNFLRTLRDDIIINGGPSICLKTIPITVAFGQGEASSSATIVTKDEDFR